MKSQALQELVGKIFSDAKTKAQFVSDPNSVLSQYALTEQEKRAVVSTNLNLGLVTCGSSNIEKTVGPLGNWSAPTP